MSAITYLQRALLVHDLQTLTGAEWEACFQRVLFPLLAYLLNNIDPKDPVAMEETRMRAATVLSKVFLHHLTPLLSLPNFYNLWLVILDFMDKYMNADKSDLLYEAIPESLKNMLLVMDSAKVFDGANGKSPLWNATWDRINQFLPTMKEDLFREINQEEDISNETQQTQVPATVDNVVQHNIENATRSIILQPPSNSKPVSSHLFAHLGQMVSTPIGSTPPPPPTFYNQPTLQPGIPYLYTESQNHTFPVLYNKTAVGINTIPITEVQQQSPPSLFSDYIDNPYNLPESMKEDEESSANAVDVNKNNDLVVERDVPNNNTNVFQSSNYFNSDFTSEIIPPGSEILFGAEKLSKDVPITTNDV